MNEKQEINEYLQIVEMKLRSLMQDIKNIRERLERPVRPTPVAPPTFFDTLKSEDDHQPRI